MPDKQAHLAQATHNNGFAKSLVDDGNGPHDWAVTVTFYAALHYFECWLVGRGFDILGEAKRKRSSPHTVRMEKARDYLPDDIATIYRTLRQQSELARYLTTTLTARGGRGHEIALPNLPRDYYTQNAAEQFYEDLQEFKKHLGY
jgi:hypothetical protein